MEKENDNLKNKKNWIFKSKFSSMYFAIFLEYLHKVNLKPSSNIKREYLYEKGIYIYPVYTPSLNSCIVEYLPE